MNCTAMIALQERRKLQDFALYREFLDPARDLLASRPSPVRNGLALTLCGLFSLAVAGACLGRVDTYAEAPGRLQPAGRSKVVQPSDAGNVQAIYVGNGSAVKQGQLLMRLDATEAKAANIASAQAVGALTAEVLRHRLAMSAASSGQMAPAPRLPAQGLEADFRRREQIVLDADLAQLQSDIADLSGKLAQNAARGNAASLALQTAQMVAATLTAQVNIRTKLHEDGWGSMVDLLTAREALQRQEMTLAADLGEKLQAETERTTLLADLAGVKTKFIDSNATDLKTAQDKLDQSKADLVKAADHAAHTDIRAPVDGTVQELGVTTLGQVVTSGQQLMTIVPATPAMQIEALVDNTDIGFVKPGQSVVVKIKAFPFTRYGTISGVVERVSHDAVPFKEASENQDQESTPPQASQADAASVPNTQNLVFPVTIRLDRSEMEVDGNRVQLSAGLQATVDIKTGRRRAISYLLSPINEVAANAMHER